MPPLFVLILFSTLIFGIGLIVALTKPQALFVLMGIELMLSAAGFNFVVFGHYDPTPMQGQAIALLVMAMATCETALTLALIWRVYKHQGHLSLR